MCYNSSDHRCSHNVQGWADSSVKNEKAAKRVVLPSSDITVIYTSYYTNVYVRDMTSFYSNYNEASCDLIGWASPSTESTERVRTQSEEPEGVEEGGAA